MANTRVGDATMAFEQERVTYLANLEQLIAMEGRFVVIKGQTIAGVRDTYEQVLELGYERFGPVPFLIAKVQRDNPFDHAARPN